MMVSQPVRNLSEVKKNKVFRDIFNRKRCDFAVILVAFHPWEIKVLIRLLCYVLAAENQCDLREQVHHINTANRTTRKSQIKLASQ